MVIVVANRISVAEGSEEEFEDRFPERARSIAELPGFIRNEVLWPIQGEHPPREAFEGPNTLEIHEVVAVKEAE